MSRTTLPLTRTEKDSASRRTRAKVRPVETSVARHERQWAAAARWQKDRLPQLAPVVEGWSWGGSVAQAEKLGGFFYDWSVRDERALLAVGGGWGTSLEAALSAAGAQSSLRALWAAGVPLPQLVAAVNTAIWQGSAGGQFVSVACAEINLASGAVEVMGAGEAALVVVGQDNSQAERLPAAPLGAADSWTHTPLRLRLAVGESLALLAWPARKSAETDPQATLQALASRLDFKPTLKSDQAAASLLAWQGEERGRRAEGAALVARRV